MIKKIFIISIFILSAGSLFAAKNSGNITGKIIDKESGEVLAYATVAIYAQDSTIAAGATAEEDGSFVIPNTLFGKYTLKADFIGYNSALVEFESKGEVTDLGVISLEPDAEMLESALVTARVPVIEQKLDKLVMNVADAVSTQGSNALDILRKAPGVAIDIDGNITLNGQAVSVWIDGRPSHMSGKDLEALLQSTDGTTIDKIEIIAHPSARYDASGSGGIINIKTKKNFLQGFNGSVTATYEAINSDPYTQSASGSVNLNYRGEKTNTFLTYSPRYQNQSAILDSWTLFGDSYQNKQESHTDIIFKNMGHSLRLGSDFFINKKNIVGFIVNGMLRDGKEQPHYGSWTKTYLDGVLAHKQTSDIQSKNNYQNMNANLNYTHIINEQMGEEITFNLDYGRYNTDKYNYQNNTFTETGGIIIDPITFQSNADQAIDIYSFKADYENVIFKSFKLEAGAKYAYTHTDNNTLREDMINGSWTTNTNLSSIFDYGEHIGAVYGSLAKMFGTKWVTKVGIRGEYTHSEGNWISAKEKTTRNYFDVFPTVYVGYNPSQNWRYSLSYTMRIQRPSYGQLNPFRQYLDANSYMEGNPQLKPQYSDNLYASVGYGQHFNIGLIFQNNRNMIVQTPYFDDLTGEKLLLWDNFGTQQLMGGSLSITELPITKWMRFTANAFLGYTNNISSIDSYKKGGFFNNLYGNITILFPKDWKAEFGVFRQGEMPYGYMNIQPMWMAFTGVKKEVLKGKGTISLNINDVFRTFGTNIYIYDGNLQTYSLEQKFNMQSFRISFNYRFGQTKATKRRKVGELEESSRTNGGSGISAPTTTTN